MSEIMDTIVNCLLNAGFYRVEVQQEIPNKDDSLYFRNEDEFISVHNVPLFHQEKGKDK